MIRLSFIAAFVAACISISLTRFSGIAALWLPNVILFAVLLRTPGSQWPFILSAGMSAIFVANMLFGLSVLSGFLLSLVNGLEVLVAAGLCHLCSKYLPPQRSLYGLMERGVLYGLIVAPASAVLGGQVVSWSFGLSFGAAFFLWWIGTLAGICILLIPALYLCRKDLLQQLNQKNAMELISVTAIGAILTTTCLIVVAQPFLYLVLGFSFYALGSGLVKVSLVSFASAFLCALFFKVSNIELAMGQSQESGLAFASHMAIVFLLPQVVGLGKSLWMQKQNKLEDLEERYHLALKSAGMGVWDWQVGSKSIHWDTHMYKLFGLPSQAGNIDYSAWRQMVHEEDVEDLEQSLEYAVKNQKLYNTQFRVRKGEGWRWIQTDARVMRDESGTAQRVVGVNRDITDIELTNQQLVVVQQRLHAILESAGDFSIIATDEGGTITYFSRGAENMLGYSRQDMVGLHTPTIIHNDAEITLASEALTEELGYPVEGFSVFTETTRRDQSISQEWNYIRKDGSRLPVRLMVSAIEGEGGEIVGFLCIAVDIRVERRTKDTLEKTLGQLSEQANQFEALFELAPEAVMVVNSLGRIVRANSKTHDLFSYPKGALVNNLIETLVPGSLREGHVGLRNAYLCEPCSREMLSGDALSAVKYDGEEIDVTVNLSPILQDGEMHVVATVHDITLQRELELNLQNAKSAAEAASVAKSQFVANMSHEIRTPMNAILSTSSLLNKTNLDRKQKRYVKMIAQSGESLLAIINDILDFSKIEANKMDLEENGFRLESAMEAIADIASASAGDKPLELAVLVPGGMPSALIGDKYRLQQVLINLLGNAIKFTASGMVALVIVVEGRSETMVTLRFSVSDTGIGISKDNQQKLFFAFEQSDTSISRSFGGTGLGLYISQQIIHLMGGSIQLESEVDKGSEFYFTLDFRIAPEDEKRDEEKELIPEKFRAWVIEPNSLNRSCMENYLSQWHWQFKSFSCISEAESKLEEKEAIDVLFINWQEAKSITEFAQRFGEAIGGSPRIIILTNPNTRGEAEKYCGKYGCGLIVKPVIGSSLYDSVAEIMGIGEGLHCRLPASSEHKPFAGVRALLAEDNEFNQIVACDLLEDEGMQLTVVENGRLALECLEENREQFDLILMDMQMPEMDGFTATREIRQRLGLNTPVIAMSAGVTANEKSRCFAVGMDDFIGKPLNIEEMFNTIAKHLKLDLIRAKRSVENEMDSSESVESQSVDVLTVLGADAGSTGSVKINEDLEVFAPTTIERMALRSDKHKKKAVDMVGNVVRRLQEGLGEVPEIVASGDLDKAKALLHELRGAVGNLGGIQMADTMWQVEDSLDNIRELELDSALEKLSSAQSSLQVEIAQWCQRHSVSG